MKKKSSARLFLFAIFSSCLFVHQAALSQSADSFQTENALELRLDALLKKMSMQEKIEQLYYKTDGNDRLGIPQFQGSDGPHGIGNGVKDFSCFPVTIAMAASWDPGLIYRVGRAIALEQAARKRHRIAGPTLDLLHDPRNGRAPETIGEDPFLGGRIGEAFIQGQGSTAVFGSIKHYNLNTYEANREKNDYRIDQRSLIEFWGPHWKRAVQDGGALSVMCAYNLVNGEKSAENFNLIKTILRDHWGFRYYTMCDWGGFWSTKKALTAELDFCEGNELYIKELPDAVKQGTVDSGMVDIAARNVLRTKILSGMIDGQPEVPAGVIDSPEHRALVYESGVKSLVLLKNEGGILPLDAQKIKSIALVGPNAAVLPLDGHSSSAVIPSYTIPVKAALDSLLGAGRVHYIQGCSIKGSDKSQFASALAMAKQSDCVVFVGGIDSTIEGEGYYIGGDRIGNTTALPGLQNELITELAKVNKKLILVVISGGTCSVHPVLCKVKGLLYAFYPGQEAGRGIADVLFGKVNPSGKLPVTMPKTDKQLPPTDMDFTNVVYEGVGYRWYDARHLTPEFAFGSGISYTTFKYSDLRLSARRAHVGDPIDVACSITNTGTREGEEVAQVYVSASGVTPRLRMPEKELKGFSKIHLNAGETKTIHIRLTSEEFYVYNEQAHSYAVLPGTYTVKVGGASDRLPLHATVTLESAEGKPDLLVKNIRTMPAFPKEGDEVVFIASLLNRGTAATKASMPHTVKFYVDGKEVADFNSTSLSIPAGGMEMICGRAIAGTPWKAKKGTFAVSAQVNPDKRIAETDDRNNSTEGEWTIPDGRIIPSDVLPFFHHTTH